MQVKNTASGQPNMLRFHQKNFNPTGIFN